MTGHDNSLVSLFKMTLSTPKVLNIVYSKGQENGLLNKIGMD